MPPTLTVLLLPGWQDSGPAHWQSIWQARHGYTRVQQHDWQRPLRGDWCARLEEHVVNLLALQKTELTNQQILGLPAYSTHPTTNHPTDAGIVLVAHSLGCHLVAAWAAASRHASAVRGALLVAPPDVTQADLPPDLYGWRKPVLQPLPFAAICVVSGNDPFCSASAGRALAAAWGSRCVEAGPRGHLNSDSGLADWPAGHAMLLDLAAV
jgi:uncharacterized protein